MKIKNIFLIFIFSLLYIPIWGLTLLDVDTSNSFSIFVGILYSMIAIYFIKNTEIVKSTKYAKVCLFMFPVFYFIASLAMIPFFLNPILWAFITLVCSMLIVNTLNIKEVFFILFISYFYAFHLHPTFKNLVPNNKFTVESIEEKNLQLSKKLQTYFFENSDNDTINITSNKKFTIIETWNEKCPPCIAAMADLQPLFDSLSPIVNHFYFI